MRRDAWLIRTDPRGDTLWTRAYPGVYGTGADIASVRMLPDRGFLLSGTDAAHDGEGWLLRTDSLGAVVWQGAWGDITRQHWDHLLCAQPTPDGGCVAFGASYTYSTPSFDAWMLRLDSVVNVGTREMPADPPPAPVTGPNITRGQLLLPPAAGNPARYELLDVTGRTLLVLDPGPNDLSLLAPGVYFLRSTADTRRPTLSKIIIAR